MQNQVVEAYRNDEKMMILIFAQWCVNHDQDPIALYSKAYPDQQGNAELNEAVELTVSKKESSSIPDEMVLNALQLFGNNDLAFVVQEIIEKRK